MICTYTQRIYNILTNVYNITHLMYIMYSPNVYIYNILT